MTTETALPVHPLHKPLISTMLVKHQGAATMEKQPPLSDQLASIASRISENGKQADATSDISKGNYALLKEQQFFSAMVPAEFGGGGVSYRDMCNALQQLAGYHPSTALSCSMHQHIIAANRFNHMHGKPGQAVLEKVAAKELVLISTGAGDWLASNGELTACEGGYSLTATKHFASGSTIGDVLVTSAPYKDPEQGWQVFHFPVAMSTEGVSIIDNWHPMGMKATGSNSVKLENVFIPEAAIAVRRPRGDFHPMWCVVLPVALPLIMSVYLGIAKTATQRARDICAKSIDPVTPYLLGEMENALTTADLAVEHMISRVENFDFAPSLELVNEIVKCKTIAAAACKTTCAKAVEVSGGLGYLEAGEIENLLRDVMASHFHPLQEKRQLLFTGSLAMGKEPPQQAF